MTKYGFLSNHLNQSQSQKRNKTPRKVKQFKTREQTAIHYLKTTQISHSDSIVAKNNSIMDGRSIDNLEQANPSAETRHLIARWKDIVKPGFFRQSGGGWKKHHEPKCLRTERRVNEEQLQQAIRKIEERRQQDQTEGFQPQSRRQEHAFEVDLFWNVDRPQAAPKNPEDRPRPSTTNHAMPQQQTTPMEEAEIDSDSDHDPSILEVPAVTWAKYMGVQSVQNNKMGYAPRTTAEGPNDWDLGNAVRQSEKNFSTDLQLLTTETTNDLTILQTLVCLERQHLENIPEEYLPSKRKLSTRYGLVFYEDRIIVPKNLRRTVISLHHKGHPAINKMSMAQGTSSGREIQRLYKRNATDVSRAKCLVKTSNLTTHNTETNQLPALCKPNEEIQLDFIGTITEKNQRFYVSLSMDWYSKWPAASLCKTTDGETTVKYLEQYITLNGIPKTNRTDKVMALTGRTFKESTT